MRFYRCFLLCFSVLMFVMSGCSSNDPLDNLVNPTSDSALGTWSGLWTLYDDELKTGGSVRWYADLSEQTLNLASNDNDNTNDSGGKYCIAFGWDGKPVFQYEHETTSPTFVGFGIIVARDSSLYDFTPARDISGGEYTSLSFSLKGELSQDTWLIVELPDSKTGTIDKIEIDSSQISNSWKTFAISSLANTDLTAIKTFVSFTLLYRRGHAMQGSGGTVYIDNIKLKK